MLTIINTITISRSQAIYEVTLFRSKFGSAILAVYETGGMRHAVKIEEISLDKNPELFDLYDFKNRQFRKGQVNDFLRAMEEAREIVAAEEIEAHV